MCILLIFKNLFLEGKGDKSDKGRVGGPLATSSPDTKEKKAKQNKAMDNAANGSKDAKEHMDVEEAQSRMEDRKGAHPEKSSTASDSTHMEFNLDEFLKIDTLPLLMVSISSVSNEDNKIFSH